MHPDLEKWLNEIWLKRMDLIAKTKAQGYMRGRGASEGLENDGVWEVYCMYNAIAGGEGGSGEKSHLTELQRQLVRLELAVKAAPTTQIGDVQKARLRGWMADADIGKLEKFAFYHYSPPKRAAATHRIYINCTAASRGAVFSSILVDQGLFSIKGLSSTKVASPTEGVRADAIVIYCGSEAAKEAALDCIEKYHTANKGNFLGTLPKLVSEARGLHGVGTAMQPPDLQLVSTGGQMYKKDKASSFGWYRSELIFMALERTRFSVPPQTEAHRKQAFKNRVEKYFRKAGIDPDHPALQGPVGALPDLASLRDWSNKIEAH